MQYGLRYVRLQNRKENESMNHLGKTNMRPSVAPPIKLAPELAAPVHQAKLLKTNGYAYPYYRYYGQQFGEQRFGYRGQQHPQQGYGYRGPQHGQQGHSSPNVAQGGPSISKHPTIIALRQRALDLVDNAIKQAPSSELNWFKKVRNKLAQVDIISNSNCPPNRPAQAGPGTPIHLCERGGKQMLRPIEQWTQHDIDQLAGLLLHEIMHVVGIMNECFADNFPRRVGQANGLQGNWWPSYRAMGKCP